MKNLFSLSIIFISFSLSAQIETIIFKKNSLKSDGKIIFINKDYLGFQASVSTNNEIKTNKGNITFTRRKEDNLFLIQRDEISSVKSGNNFKEFLISSNSKMNLFEDRLTFNEQNISKFRKLQLTGRWMSILGSGVSLLGGVLIASDNTNTYSNPYTFSIIGAVIGGVGFIIDLSSFSKLKFEKQYDRIDKKDGYYFK